MMYANNPDPPNRVKNIHINRTIVGSIEK